MTDPELRKDEIRRAQIAEAKRWALDMFPDYSAEARADQAMHRLAVLIEQKWRPEPEVDAVTLAFREWGKKRWGPEFEGAKHDHGTVADAFRAGHAHAQANCADVRRMDWLEGRHVGVGEPHEGRDGWEIYHTRNPDTPLRTKIDQALEATDDQT